MSEFQKDLKIVESFVSGFLYEAEKRKNENDNTIDYYEKKVDELHIFIAKLIEKHKSLSGYYYEFWISDRCKPVITIYGRSAWRPTKWDYNNRLLVHREMPICDNKAMLSFGNDACITTQLVDLPEIVERLGIELAGRNIEESIKQTRSGSFEREILEKIIKVLIKIPEPSYGKYDSLLQKIKSTEFIGYGHTHYEQHYCSYVRFDRWEKQLVYNEKNEEGPFSVCCFGNYYRIECEFDNWDCTVIPHFSISELVETLGLRYISKNKATIVKTTKKLNELVSKNDIIKIDGVWKPKESENNNE